MSKTAMKLALDALKRMKRYGNTFGYRSHGQNSYEQVCEAITALEALAKQPSQQEPVAFLVDGDLYYPEEIDWETLQEQGHTVAPLYTSPPAQRKPLTDEQIDKLPWGPHEGNPMTFAEGLRDFARAIEAAHGIKE